MATFQEAKADLDSIRDIAPASPVEIEEDMDEGYYILKIPVTFIYKTHCSFGYAYRSDEDED